MAAVRGVLQEIGAGEVPELVVFNKVDQAGEIGHLLRRHEASIAVSASSGRGIDDLLLTLGDRLRVLTSVIELVVPYTRGDVLASVYREGEVLVETHEETGTRFRARLDSVSQSVLAEYIVGDSAPLGKDA
jgi:GTP-binding protein HflX